MFHMSRYVSHYVGYYDGHYIVLYAHFFTYELASSVVWFCMESALILPQ